MQVTSDFSSIKSYNPPLRPQRIFPPVELQGPSQDEITLSRFKKTMSECRYAVLAASILFFAVRRNLRNNESIDRAIAKRKFVNIIRNKKAQVKQKAVV